MTFPPRGIEIIQALYTANPQNDDERRIHIQRVGEQMCFEWGPQWGNKKRAGLSDAFRSPDSIAFLEADGTVSVWDIQSSSGQILVGAGQEPHHGHIPPGEATFMPCQPVNHLGAVPNPGPVEPDPGTPPPSDEFKELRMLLTTALVSLEELKANQDVTNALLTQLQLRHDPVPIAQEIRAKQQQHYGGTLGLPAWLGGTRPIHLEPK